MMGKLSNEDKMHIQMLHEQTSGAKAIKVIYPDKNELEHFADDLPSGRCNGFRCDVLCR